VPILEGVPNPEGAPVLIPEGAPAPVGVLQKQGQTCRPNAQYIDSEWSNLTQTQELRSGTLYNVYTSSRLEALT